VRPAVRLRPAHKLLRISTERGPDRTDTDQPAPPERTLGHTYRQQPAARERSGWWFTLLAVPVLCCAGSALLAAIGISSLGALLAVGTGQVALAVVLAAAAVVTVVVLAAAAVVTVVVLAAAAVVTVVVLAGRRR